MLVPCFTLIVHVATPTPPLLKDNLLGGVVEAEANGTKHATTIQASKTKAIFFIRFSPPAFPPSNRKQNR